jgi:serine/threonine protein kinase/Flp pilus assembly protein TadD
MGEVYLARDPRLERNVAIKVLPDRVAADPEALARFEHENKAVAALSHPNIRVIYDIGSGGGRTYAVMELLEGETLGERLERGPIPWEESVPLALQTAEGLAAAHGRGIVHRDIKPQNIFLTGGGVVKLLDFGLARSHSEPAAETGPDRDSTLTHDVLPEGFQGTVPYMAPEQVRSEPADARSDIFSFGVVFYEMLAGKRLFDRKTPAETVGAILHEKPAALSRSGIRVPAELQRVINLCLEKDPDNRFQTLEDIILLLKNLNREGEQPGAECGRDASVAVLPFVNLGKGDEDDYFSEGLSEELINSLVKIGGLHVASRTSSAVFRGGREDIRHIGERLNVRTVLEGSVRRSGKRVRITAQLIKAADGYHLWSESFDRNLDDVFAVQGEIAAKIAESLRIVLTEKEKEAISRPPTENPEAYDYVFQGRREFYRYQRKGFEQALKLFRRAIRLDPGYAGAYAWAAYCHVFLYSWFDATEENLREAESAAVRALTLDPELAEAHVARGLALSLRKQMRNSEREFETGLRLRPDLYEVVYLYARHAFSRGQYEKAALLAEKAVRLRPDDYNAPYLLGMVLRAQNRRKEALAAYRACLERAENHLELFPEDTRARYFGAAALIDLGRAQEALEWTEQVLEASPEEPMTLYGVACNLARLGRPDKAVSTLERARLFGSLPRSWLEKDPDLDGLRDRPRFQAFLKQLRDD